MSHVDNLTIWDKLEFIAESLQFFIENNIEGECVECESETICEIYERIFFVMSQYYEDNDYEDDCESFEAFLEELNKIREKVENGNTEDFVEL